jgi:hypothetical protein
MAPAASRWAAWRANDVDRTVEPPRNRRARQPDAARAHDRNPVAALHARARQRVNAARDRLDQRGVGGAHGLRQQEDVPRVDDDRVGHSSVGPDPVVGGRPPPALRRRARGAAVADTARARRPHRDRRAVRKRSADLVTEGHRHRPEADEVEVGPADARSHDPDHGAVIGRIGDRDDLDPIGGVANRAPRP